MAAPFDATYFLAENAYSDSTILLVVFSRNLCLSLTRELYAFKGFLDTREFGWTAV